MNSKRSFISPFLVFLILLILKVTGVLQISWIWVTSPIWIVFVIAFGILSLSLLIVIIALLIGFSTTDIIEIAEKYKNKLGKSK